MPELPEVETVRRRLAPLVEGRTVVAARIADPRLVQPERPRDVEARLDGRGILAVGRRGKHLLVELDGDETLLVHLRMTGNLLHAAEPSLLAGEGHVRAVLDLDDGARVIFTDVRRFGTWHLRSTAERDAYLDARLGPEPVADGCDGGVLRRALAGRRAPVKALLLDQRVVAGVGNIYADEALFRAGIDPRAEGGALGPRRTARLAAAVREAIEEGIRAQGASIRDYRNPQGGYGSMQERFMVYGRGGEACVRCGAELARGVVAGRGTVWCRRCQRS